MTKENKNKKGWICPVCGKVNAPWMPSCPCGGEHKKDYPNYPNYPYTYPYSSPYNSHYPYTLT